MGESVWNSTDAPWGKETLGSMVAGVERDVNGGNARNILDSGDKLENALFRLTVGGREVLDANGQPIRYDNNSKYALDFGVFREAIKNQSFQRSENGASGETDVLYYSGPWRWAQMKSEELVNITRNDWLGIGNESVNSAAKAIAEIGAPSAATAVTSIDDMVDYLINNTEIWGSGEVDTVDHMMGQVGSVSSGQYKTLYDIIAASLSLPAVTAPTIAFTSFLWAAPTVTISAPTEVVVDDLVDDAVEAATDLNDARVAVEEGNLRASLLAANALAPSGFYVALELLGARSTAAMLDYDKSLRAEQIRTVTEAKLRHKQNLLDRDKAQADANIAVANAQNQWNDTNVRAGLGKGEVELRAKQAALEGDLAQLRIRSEVIKVIYDTVISWMQAKGMIISNAGPLASVINNGADLAVKASIADREAWTSWAGAQVDIATKLSAGYEGVSQLKWKSMLQNMMVIKEGVSAYQGIGGVEHMPSGFEKVTQPVSAALGVASTIGNLVNIFS